MEDMTAIALIKYRQELARAAIDSELARAFPREALPLRLARRLRHLAALLEGSREHPSPQPTQREAQGSASARCSGREPDALTG